MKRSTGATIDGQWCPHFRWRGMHFPAALRRVSAHVARDKDHPFEADVDKRTGHALYVAPGGERLTVQEIKEKFQ